LTDAAVSAILHTSRTEVLDMSYWAYLVDNHGDAVEVEPHQEGGTYVLGGMSTAELNVTYNYSKLFRVADLDGMTGAEAFPILAERVEFGTAQDDDYWKPTPGNVGYMCRILARWAKQHPTARFQVH
jgi:hypothetical protein